MRKIKLEDISSISKPSIVDYEGVDIPIYYKRGSNQKLIVIFHGAVDQTVRKIPFFQSHLDGLQGVHQISIADPTLARNSKLKTSWYLGANDIPLQKILPQFFQDLCKHLKVKRTIYFGASSGGHAALHYSHRHPESLAVAANPQTTLSDFLESAVGNYRVYCWPELKQNSELTSVVAVDLGELYAESVPNFVCIINSCGDRYHLFKQTMPLMSKIQIQGRNKFILHCDFYGVLGHSGAIPYKSCAAWIDAATQAPDFRPDNILKTYYQLSDKIANASAAPVAAQALAEPSDDDIRVARALRNWQI